MTAAQVRDIIVSDELRQEPQQISWYLASVKQERAIVFALARRLWEQDIPYRLEADRTDLVVGNKKFEFKVTYDFGMARLVLQP